MRVRRRWVALAGLAVAAAAALVAVVLTAGGSAPVAPATATVRRGTVTLAVAAAGTVQSSQTRGLSFSVAGPVTEVDVKAGDLVSAGQMLARVDPADAQSAVDSAAARVRDAQDAVDRAEASAARPTCTTAAPRPSASAGPATPTRIAVDRAVAATQNCNPATSRGSSDGLLQAQQQLNNARLGLTQARNRLAGTTITAPLAGRVLSVAGKVGSQAAPGGTGFIVLGEVSTLTVRAQVSEADVGRITVGQAAAITLPDRPDTLAGTVSAIDPAGTVTSRLVRYGVVIAITDTPADLLLGQSATVVVTTASADDALYVSSAAVTGVSGDTGRVRLRQGGDRRVTIGLRGDQYTQIMDGLAEGDEVLLP